jgi:hypothetical protein
VLFADKCMEMENIMLNVEPGSKDQRLHDFPHMWKLDL